MLMGNGETCLRIIREWMEVNQVELSSEKSQASLLRGKRGRDNICWRAEGTVFSLKCLGVWLDDRMWFKVNVKRTVEKAENLSY